MDRQMTPVQEWQKVIGVDPDGVFGMKTLLASMAAIGKPVQSSGQMFQGKAQYPVKEIVVHCAATRPDWMAQATFTQRFAELRRWHMQDRGWADIGYHHVIDRDGAVMAGRPETTIGAGVAGHNNGVIHVCLLGGHGSAETDQFAENFTPEQDAALRKLIEEISSRAAITRVSGHNEYAAKACPGFHVRGWLQRDKGE
jgi:N-acetyl-anhydromuramyl-L-alanine amidase AmpD